MAVSNSHITILTLNVNALNAPIKRHRLANWIKSQKPLVCHIQETHLTCKDTQRLKRKGWRKIYQANGEQKNKILCEQASTQRFCHHEACFTRAPDRNTKQRNEQPVPATPKTYQMVKAINKIEEYA